MKKIRKAVIPAAGFGTRFLPQTKAMPKEMIPIVDKPVIQYVVEEAVAAGIEDIILVTGWHKRSIEDHFDYPFELLHRLKEAGKDKQAAEVARTADLANFIYIRQKGPTGNAIPMWNARNIIGDDPFLLLWADDFIMAQPKSRSQQLIEAYEKYESCILCGIRTTKDDDANKYAFAEGDTVEAGVIKTRNVIEKPGPENRPSDLAIVSGYVFIPEIFDEIDHMITNQLTAAGGEYVYTTALELLRKKGHDIYAIEVENGKYFDTGNKLEYMKTVTEFAMKHDEIGGEYREFLKSLEL